MPAKDILSLTPFDASNAKTYDALCHCGTVRYTVALSPPLHEQQVVECNCSLCTRNGYLNVYPYRENVKVTSGQDALKTYTFGSKMILHQFCGRCGSSVFFDPQLPKRGEKMDLVGVNVRMIKGIELKGLQVVQVDGWNEFPFVGSEYLK